MAEDWIRELAKGIGMFFVNPLLYWTFLLIVLTGIKRMKKERNHFGIKVFDLYSEWRKTWGTALIAGLVLSVIFLGAGMVFSVETIFLLGVISIVLSIALRFTHLSPSYTIGLTFLLLLFIPFILDKQTYLGLDNDLFTATNFSGLTILLGLLLIVEAILIRRVKRDETFPELLMGKRGKWVGQHHVKKATLIPFFVLVPSGAITAFAPFWPVVSLAGDSYSIVLVPFLIGFDFTVKGSMIQRAGKRLAGMMTALGVIVLATAVGSVFLSWLSFVAVLIAIVGREYIRYRHRIRDNNKLPYFHAGENGLKILAVIPGSPAANLHVYAGETIYRVNGQRVQEIDDFYQALQTSGAFFKLEVIDDAGEVRFVQRAFYQGEHYELGILFTKEKYRETS